MTAEAISMSALSSKVSKTWSLLRSVKLKQRLTTENMQRLGKHNQLLLSFEKIWSAKRMNPNIWSHLTSSQ